MGWFVFIQFPKGISFYACALPMNDIYVMYIMLCEFLVFILFSFKLIHKKAQSPRQVNSLDVEM